VGRLSFKSNWEEERSVDTRKRKGTDIPKEKEEGRAKTA